MVRTRVSSLAVVAAVVAVTLLAVAAQLAAARPSPSSAPSAPGSGPVLLELFTSQGCSSCPPADELLSRLAADPELGGRVVPLAFHVDYWNRLGWRDPFSDARWSERQRRYARALDADNVYTPMLVVDGRRHLVGSREREVRAAVRAALAAPRAAVLELSLGEAIDGRFPATVEARFPERSRPRRVEVWVALWQDGLVTPVRRGENAERTLRNDRVVRRLVRAAAWSAEDRPPFRARAILELDPAWPRDELGVAAFLADPVSSEVLAAADRSLP